MRSYSLDSPQTASLTPPDAAGRRFFPMFPEGSWWPLRDRFKQSVPPVVTADYLSAVLGVEAKTARNLLATLKGLGLLDRDGAPTERANRWRVDAEYPRVCGEMLREIYPASYAADIPDPSADLRGAVAWFMQAAGVGEPAARRMARFHGLLRERAPKRATGIDHGPGTTLRPHHPPPLLTPEPPAAATTDEPPAGSRGRATEQPSELRIGLAADHTPSAHSSAGPDAERMPAPRLDFHLHISPEMTEHQIDAVFRSMATHLFGRPRA